jgi:hypothetical protein
MLGPRGALRTILGEREMSKVENLQTTDRAEPFPCVSVALVVLAMFVLSWLAAKGVQNNLQPLLIFAGLCLPIFIAELRNHHNKWAIIVFDAVPVITYAFGYLVLRGPVLTGSMVLWLAGFGVSICIWFAALVWACTRVRPRAPLLSLQSQRRNNLNL